MHRIGATTVLLLFMLIAVFGFTSMSNHIDAGTNDCIASIGHFTLCPHQNPLSMIDLHSELLRKLTNTTALILVVAGAVFVLLGSVPKPANQKIVSVTSAGHQRSVAANIRSYYQHLFLSWLAHTQHRTYASVL